jgi:hypothetical protein
MPRKPDSGRIDLVEIFRRVQTQMLSDLSVGGLFEHASSAGAATEHHWIALFERYLPKRYRAAPAFVIDADGHRSRQIDIAIFDNLYSPPLFPHKAGLHLPAENVYAVFEVKPTISKQWLRDAAEKAASVRALRRTSVPVIAAGNHGRAIKPSPILAGLLATSSVWSPETFGANVRNALATGTDLSVPSGKLGTGFSDLSRPSASGSRNSSSARGRAACPHFSEPSARGQSSLSPLPRPHRSSLSPDPHRIDLGCSLKHGAFEQLRIPSPYVHISDPDESLIFFMLRLLDRLRELGTAPAADLMEYGRSLRSFRR